MKFFDTHVHFFPDKLAGKALPKLNRYTYSETHSDGTRSGTVKNFAEWAAPGAWCCTSPPTPTSRPR